MTDGQAIEVPITQCVAVIGTVCFGPFDTEEEADTFLACGPHGMEDQVDDGEGDVFVLYPPHATTVELLGPADIRGLGTFVKD